jgi:hypothetical protein
MERIVQRRMVEKGVKYHVNQLNVELNLICHLLALLGAHHTFHVSWLKVKTTYGALK